MKVIIDLIEDIRESIDNDKCFTLGVMGLSENEDGEFTPSWQSAISGYRLDDRSKKMFLFLGKEGALSIGTFTESLNALSNEAMMYELRISYMKGDQREDAPLMGFGESLQDKKYLLFISDQLH
jgi:hypothetical protein